MNEWRRVLGGVCAQYRRFSVLGVGSELCGDDAAGMLLISRLQQLLVPGENWQLLAGSTAPENFTGLIRSFKPELLILVDAAQLELAVGEIALIELESFAPGGFSTHMLPLNHMLSYLSEQLGCQVLVIGIQPGTMDFATPPGAAIVSAVDELALALSEFFQQSNRS